MIFIQTLNAFNHSKSGWKCPHKMNNVKDKLPSVGLICRNKLPSVGLICMNKLNNPKSSSHLTNTSAFKLTFNSICELLTAAAFHSYKQQLMVVDTGGGRGGDSFAYREPLFWTKKLKS